MEIFIPLGIEREKKQSSFENIARVRLFSEHVMTSRILYLLSTLYTGASNGP